jgi:hypothetical protein
MPDRPDHHHPIEQHLYDYLHVNQQLKDVVLRATDLNKLVHGAEHELNNLQQMTDVINSKQLEDVFKNVEANTKLLVDASAAAERASASLEIMQVILAGSFAFDIVDRMSGGTLNITVPDWINTVLVEGIISIPFLWFFLNMLWLLFIGKMLLMLMAYLGELANGAVTLRIQFNTKVDLEKLEIFLKSKTIEVTDSVSEPTGDLKKCAFMETDKVLWQGEPPKVEMAWNATYGFLLGVTISVNGRNTKLNDREMVETLKKMFIAANVMTKDAAGLSEEEEEGEKKGETGGEGEGDGGEETVKK